MFTDASAGCTFTDVPEERRTDWPPRRAGASLLTVRLDRTPRDRGRVLPAIHTLLLLGGLALAVTAGCGGGGKPAGTATPAGGTEGSSSAPPPAAAPESAATGAAAAPADLGSKVFAQRCALCHGPDGRGDGPGSVALNPKPRNFHDQAYMKTRTDAQLLEVIQKGKGAMPRWQGVISDAEIQAALEHVRELGEKP